MTRRLPLYVLSFACFTVFAGLAKSTFLFIGAALVVLVTLDLMLRGGVRLGCGLLLGYLAALVGAWVALGQDVTALPQMLGHALELSRGYNAAMGMPTGIRVTALGALAGCMALGATLGACLASKPGGCRSSLRVATCFCAVLGLLFACWKQGFVRADYMHTTCFLPSLLSWRWDHQRSHLPLRPRGVGPGCRL
jgi:hypothetical protein